MLLSYFDKAVIFLLPILVLQLFKDQTVYLSIEYIYSITIVIIPFLDLGLVGYIYYIYRNKRNKRAIVQQVNKVFHIVYISCFCLGLILILVHHLIFPIDEHIVYIVTRAIFMSTFAFFSSYYRLINKPHRVLFVTISANVISLLFLFVFVALDLEFELWLIFIGQILFCVIYFFKTTRFLILKWSKYYKKLEVVKLVKAALLFSWPTILQVFIMMYIANYGKINALDKMSLDDGVLLSLTQRFSMVIFLTHTSFLAFFTKDLYSDIGLYSINKAIFLKYLFFLMSSVAFVFSIIFGYLIYNLEDYNLKRSISITLLLIAHTFLSCVYSYFELYYGRENRNVLKLYLAIFLGILFVVILNILKIEFLEKLALAMFVSIFATFILNLIILYKRNYRIE